MIEGWKDPIMAGECGNKSDGVGEGLGRGIRHPDNSSGSIYLLWHVLLIFLF